MFDILVDKIGHFFRTDIRLRWGMLIGISRGESFAVWTKDYLFYGVDGVMDDPTDIFEIFEVLIRIVFERRLAGGLTGIPIRGELFYEIVLINLCELPKILVLRRAERRQPVLELDVLLCRSALVEKFICLRAQTVKIKF